MKACPDDFYLLIYYYNLYIHYNLHFDINFDRSSYKD